MRRLIRYHIAGTLLLTLVVLAAAAEPKPLDLQERLFIRAAASMVISPDGTHAWADAESLTDAAKRTGLKKNWTESTDPIVKALVSIERKPELRQEYRKRLGDRLGERPNENGKKLLEEIKKNFAEDKLNEYREVIKAERFERGSLPFPLCIPFHNCEG